MAWLSAIALVTGIVPREAGAEGLRRIDAAWLLPSGLTVLAVGGADPAPGSGTWLRLGQSRLFGLSSLPARSAAVGCRGGGLAFEAGWDATGRDAFRDDRGRLRLEAGRRGRVGVDAAWRRVRPGPGEVLARGSLALAVGINAPAGVLGTCDLRINVPLARWGQVSLGDEPDRRLTLALGGPGRAVALAWETDADGRPSGSWEALCGIGDGLGIAWRADGGSGALGGGVVWQRGALRVRSSHLAHPDLGLTHRLEVALGRVGGSPW